MQLRRPKFDRNAPPPSCRPALCLATLLAAAQVVATAALQVRATIAKLTMPTTVQMIWLDGWARLLCLIVLSSVIAARGEDKVPSAASIGADLRDEYLRDVTSIPRFPAAVTVVDASDQIQPNGLGVNRSDLIDNGIGGVDGIHHFPSRKHEGSTDHHSLTTLGISREFHLVRMAGCVSDHQIQCNVHARCWRSATILTLPIHGNDLLLMIKTLAGLIGTHPGSLERQCAACGIRLLASRNRQIMSVGCLGRELLQGLVHASSHPIHVIDSAPHLVSRDFTAASHFAECVFHSQPLECREDGVTNCRDEQQETEYRYDGIRMTRINKKSPRCYEVAKWAYFILAFVGLVAAPTGCCC